MRRSGIMVVLRARAARDCRKGVARQAIVETKPRYSVAGIDKRTLEAQLCASFKSR
jgi:hypothetical protein